MSAMSHLNVINESFVDLFSLSTSDVGGKCEKNVLCGYCKNVKLALIFDGQINVNHSLS